MKKVRILAVVLSIMLVLTGCMESNKVKLKTEKQLDEMTDEEVEVWHREYSDYMISKMVSGKRSKALTTYNVEYDGYEYVLKRGILYKYEIGEVDEEKHEKIVEFGGGYLPEKSAFFIVDDVVYYGIGDFVRGYSLKNNEHEVGFIARDVDDVFLVGNDIWFAKSVYGLKKGMDEDGKVLKKLDFLTKHTVEKDTGNQDENLYDYVEELPRIKYAFFGRLRVTDNVMDVVGYESEKFIYNRYIYVSDNDTKQAIRDGSINCNYNKIDMATGENILKAPFNKKPLNMIIKDGKSYILAGSEIKHSSYNNIANVGHVQLKAEKEYYLRGQIYLADVNANTVEMLVSSKEVKKFVISDETKNLYYLIEGDSNLYKYVKNGENTKVTFKLDGKEIESSRVSDISNFKGEGLVIKKSGGGWFSRTSQYNFDDLTNEIKKRA